MFGFGKKTVVAHNPLSEFRTHVEFVMPYFVLRYSAPVKFGREWLIPKDAEGNPLIFRSMNDVQSYLKASGLDAAEPVRRIQSRFGPAPAKVEKIEGLETGYRIRIEEHKEPVTLHCWTCPKTAADANIRESLDKIANSRPGIPPSNLNTRTIGTH